MRAGSLKGAFILFLLFCGTALSQWNTSDIIISEVMFNAPSGNNEFIEIYNKNETTPINIFGFKFKYYNSGTDSIMSGGKGTTLPPKSYAVIFEGDYSFLTGLYSSLVPENALKLTIDDNAFGSNGMSNTSGRTIVLLSNYNDTVDVYTYSANNNSGYSDEKIVLNNDTSASNWGNSVRYLGTPSFRNSVVPLANDLYLSSLKIIPAAPYENSDVTLQGTVRNIGTNNTGRFYVNIYSASNLLKSFDYSSLARGDSSVFEYQFNSGSAGSYSLKADIVIYNDNDTSNNYAVINYNVIHRTTPGGQVAINEIMYAPSAGQPEWIELYNRSNLILNLKKWRVSDNVSYANITTGDKLFYPGEYVVLCRDTSLKNYYKHDINVIYMSLPQLNNSGDRIVIRDSLLQLVDSLDYLPSWGGASGGYSLERIKTSSYSSDSLNWGTSESQYKSTPGYINSLSPKEKDIEAGKLVFNPSLPIYGDNVSVSLLLRNKGISDAFVNVNLFEDTDLDSIPDILRQSIADVFITAGDSLLVDFSYRIENLTTIKGFYCRVEYSGDNDTSNNWVYVLIHPAVAPGYSNKSIVINEIMYDPLADGPEWVEIYNPSDSVINLNGWRVSDVVNPEDGVISSNDLFISPDDFLVLVKDSLFNAELNESGIKSENVKFGALGNTGDGVVIYDSRNAVIDSVFYSTGWVHKKGFSVERFSPSGSSNDSTNWAISISQNGSTPGRHNSVANLLPAEKNSLIVNEIMYDPEDGNCEFVELFNKSGKYIDIAGWTIIDKYNNKNRLSDYPVKIKNNEYFLIAADSSFISHYNYSGSNLSVLNISSLGLTTDGIIVLHDAFGNTVDSVQYSSKWHNKVQSVTKNKSLERINPFLPSNDSGNWSTSVNINGATPGEKNSIYIEQQVSPEELSVTPNPFSPDNDGFEDVAFITYRFGFPVSSLVFKIFDSKGRLVKSITDVNISSSEGSIIFNGNGDDNNTLRMGIYILLAEGKNYFTGQIKTLKSPFVVARRLN